MATRSLLLLLVLLAVPGARAGLRHGLVGDQQQALVNSDSVSASVSTDAPTDKAVFWTPVTSAENTAGTKPAEMAAAVKKYSEQLTLLGNKAGSKISPTILYSGDNLATIGASQRLFVIAHGTYYDQLVTVSGKTLTAHEVAARLKASHLPTTHKDIELIICNAGGSLASKATMDKALTERNKWAALPPGKPKDAAKKKAQAAFDILEKESDSHTDAQDLYTDPKKQAKPFAQHLSDELKKLDYAPLIGAYVPEIQFVVIQGHLAKHEGNRKILITGVTTLQNPIIQVATADKEMGGKTNNDYVQFN